MTAPVTTYSAQTLKRSACALLVTAIAKVPAMYREGMDWEAVEAHLFVTGSMAQDLFDEAGEPTVAAAAAEVRALGGAA